MTKVGIVVGRFQPLHNGHIKLIGKALEECDNVEVRIGREKEFGPRTTRNPLQQFEVWTMIETYFDVEIAEGRLVIDVVYDVIGDDTMWVHGLLQPICDWYDGQPERTDYTFYCHLKDHESYLNIFEDTIVEVKEVNTGSVNMVNATNIRHLFLEHNLALTEIFGLPFISMHWLNKVKNEHLIAEGVESESII